MNNRDKWRESQRTLYNKHYIYIYNLYRPIDTELVKFEQSVGEIVVYLW